MSYRRRALQRRLDELRDVLDGDAVDKLAERLHLGAIYRSSSDRRSFRNCSNRCPPSF